eukprot:Awhi_evm1s9200
MNSTEKETYAHRAGSTMSTRDSANNPTIDEPKTIFDVERQQKTSTSSSSMINLDESDTYAQRAANPNTQSKMNT